MKRIIIGIDPGIRGAMAVIKEAGTFEVHDLKSYYAQTGSFRSLDPVLFNQLIGSAIPYECEPEDIAVFCEESQVMGCGGIKASSKSLRSIYGSRETIRTLFIIRGGIKINYIQPQTWKRKFGLLKQDKWASCEKASATFPESKDIFWKKYQGRLLPLDGRAEATLIAHYGWLTLTAE